MNGGDAEVRRRIAAAVQATQDDDLVAANEAYFEVGGTLHP
jgi:hypothetical protein